MVLTRVSGTVCCLTVVAFVARFDGFLWSWVCRFVGFLWSLGTSISMTTDRRAVIPVIAYSSSSVKKRRPTSENREGIALYALPRNEGCVLNDRLTSRLTDAGAGVKNPTTHTHFCNIPFHFFDSSSCS
ncbi:hypothetical protein BC832DRAFT_567576 [Gaertneriomyces semiglobifer]|nr:hypothetical protein BC832DRAFT_567576 [Gaertneriomyces semiglobifer]